MICKFHVRHVKVEAEKLLGFMPTAWSDGSSLVVSVGYGHRGRTDAKKLQDNCQLPSSIQESVRIGSIADQERWRANGVDRQFFLIITRPSELRQQVITTKELAFKGITYPVGTKGVQIEGEEAEKFARYAYPGTVGPPIATGVYQIGIHRFIAPSGSFKKI